MDLPFCRSLGLSQFGFVSVKGSNSRFGGFKEIPYKPVAKRHF